MMMDQEKRHGSEVKKPDFMKRICIALLAWSSSSFCG